MTIPLLFSLLGMVEANWKLLGFACQLFSSLTATSFPASQPWSLFSSCSEHRLKSPCWLSLALSVWCVLLFNIHLWIWAFLLFLYTLSCQSLRISESHGCLFFLTEMIPFLKIQFFGFFSPWLSYFPQARMAVRTSDNTAPEAVCRCWSQKAWVPGSPASFWLGDLGDLFNSLGLFYFLVGRRRIKWDTACKAACQAHSKLAILRWIPVTIIQWQTHLDLFV